MMRFSEAVARAVRARIESDFAAGQAPGGNEWAPYAARTAARKGAYKTTLVDTGAMLASLNVTAAPSDVHVSWASPAGYHDSGTRHMETRALAPRAGDYDTLIEQAFEEEVANGGFEEVQAAWNRLPRL